MTRMSCKRKGPLVPICNDDKSTPSNNVQIGLMSNVQGRAGGTVMRYHMTPRT